MQRHMLAIATLRVLKQQPGGRLKTRLQPSPIDHAETKTHLHVVYQGFFHPAATAVAFSLTFI